MSDANRPKQPLSVRDAVDIEAWLRELGLERYEQAFRENEIDAEILPKLTIDDLKMRIPRGAPRIARCGSGRHSPRQSG
jgi:hypothetical protein